MLNNKNETYIITALAVLLAVAVVFGIKLILKLRQQKRAILLLQKEVKWLEQEKEDLVNQAKMNQQALVNLSYILEHEISPILVLACLNISTQNRNQNKQIIEATNSQLKGVLNVLRASLKRAKTHEIG